MPHIEFSQDEIYSYLFVYGSCRFLFSIHIYIEFILGHLYWGKTYMLWQKFKKTKSDVLNI